MTSAPKTKMKTEGWRVLDVTMETFANLLLQRANSCKGKQSCVCGVGVGGRLRSCCFCCCGGGGIRAGLPASASPDPGSSLHVPSSGTSGDSILKQ